MGLDITCHSVCGEQLSNETCRGFSGCRWSRLVSDDVTHACLPAEAGGGESTIWVGVVLSLVAGTQNSVALPVYSLRVLAVSA